MKVNVIPLTNKGGAKRGSTQKRIRFYLSVRIATGASWLCFIKRARRGGHAGAAFPRLINAVFCFTVLFSRLFFGERLTKTGTVGLIAMMLGTLTRFCFILFFAHHFCFVFNMKHIVINFALHNFNGVAMQHFSN